MNGDVSSSAISNLLSPKWSDLSRLSHPSSRIPSHSRSCSRSCHAGSFPACQEKQAFLCWHKDSPFPTPFPKPRDLLASSTWRRSSANLGRKGKEHNNPPVDRFLPYNRGWTGRSTQVLEKTKTQLCQSAQSMAQDNDHRYSSSVGPSLLGTVWYCTPSHLHHHPTIEASCVTCLGLDFSTYLSMQPSVQSHESTNMLEKLLR